MASQVTRFAWTDDSGTPASPVGNGTKLDNAQLQLIFDAVDALFASGTFTLGGLLSVEGFGTHLVSAGGTGQNVLRVRNTTAGTGNSSAVQLGNNAATAVGALAAFSSTYATASGYFADGVLLEATRAGGLSIIASNAAGDLRFYAGGYTERMSIADTGAISLIGPATFQLAPLLAANATALSGGGGVVTLPGTQGYVELTAANFVDTDIVGISGGVAGKIVVVSNVDAGHSYTIYHEAASATAADRFFLPADADVTLAYGEAIVFAYSATISRWVACLG